MPTGNTGLSRQIVSIMSTWYESGICQLDRKRYYLSRTLHAVIEHVHDHASEARGGDDSALIWYNNQAAVIVQYILATLAALWIVKGYAHYLAYLSASAQANRWVEEVPDGWGMGFTRTLWVTSASIVGSLDGGIFNTLKWGYHARLFVAILGVPCVLAAMLLLMVFAAVLLAVVKELWKTMYWPHNLKERFPQTGDVPAVVTEHLD
jgi:hypothetical protein